MGIAQTKFTFQRNSISTFPPLFTREFETQKYQLFSHPLTYFYNNNKVSVKKSYISIYGKYKVEKMMEEKIKEKLKDDIDAEIKLMEYEYKYE